MVTVDIMVLVLSNYNSDSCHIGDGGRVNI